MPNVYKHTRKHTHPQKSTGSHHLLLINPPVNKVRSQIWLFRTNVYTSRFWMIFESSQNGVCLVGTSFPYLSGAFCTHLEPHSCHISNIFLLFLMFVVNIRLIIPTAFPRGRRLPTDCLNSQAASNRGRVWYINVYIYSPHLLLISPPPLLIKNQIWTFRKNVYTSWFWMIFESSQNGVCLVGKSFPTP